MSSMFKVRWANAAPFYHYIEVDEPAFYYEIEEEANEKPWFYDIKRYLETQEYPEDAYITYFVEVLS